MKKFIVILILVTTIATLVACGRGESYVIRTPETLQDALDIAALRRESIVMPDYMEISHLTEGRVRVPRYGGISGRIVMFQRDVTRHAYITAEDAIADIWLLHELLREVYGGYVYFGGDDVFMPLFETMEAELLGYGCNIFADFLGIGGDVIAFDAFSGFLHWRLSAVIADNHFIINNIVFSSAYSYYHSPIYTYDRSAAGFRNRETGLYLVEIIGHDIDDIMKLHMDYNGDMFYRPVIIVDYGFARTDEFAVEFITSQNPEQLVEDILIPKTQISFVYEDGERETRLFSTMSSREYICINDIPLPTLEFVAGIPVVTVMIMGVDDRILRGAEHIAPFLSFAEYLRNEPVIIVDLRNNHGGNGALPIEWLYALTGEIIFPNFIGLGTLYSDMRGLPSTFFRNQPDAQRFFLNHEPFKNEHTISNVGSREVIERDQILVILTDRFAGSAAEIFVDITFNMTNTLVIGSPTQGTLLLSGDYTLAETNLTLPNTGIPLGFGTTLHIWPEGHFAEGVGIKPDIWVDGDALTAAVALLRNAGFGDDI